jgi:hypothetical protein
MLRTAAEEKFPGPVQPRSAAWLPGALQKLFSSDEKMGIASDIHLIDYHWDARSCP